MTAIRVSIGGPGRRRTTAAFRFLYAGIEYAIRRNPGFRGAETAAAERRAGAADLETISAQPGQFDGLALLPIRDGPVIAGSADFFQYRELTLSFYQFESGLHHHIRTTNYLERLFREFRTKSDEIGAFPNETSCLTMFCLVVERDHAKPDRRKKRE
jgi:Transposase, Mutator family